MKNIVSLPVRELRYKLFQIDNADADKLRRELFELEDQDSPAPAELAHAAESILEALDA